ncbi:MAG: DegT/DnrJ/EryC1/StrS family aminotransferase [candidate division WOR-3 bacterium]|jgi:dTDP-4-amino-4,6-dideoxygalactose transaminase
MIPFCQLNRDKEEFGRIKKRLDEFYEKGKFILGQFNEEFEKVFGNFIGKKYVVGTGNATDSLYLIFRVLKAKRVALCASNPLPCAQAINMAGCEMVLFDTYDDTGLINIEQFKKSRKKIDVLLAVHLYGQAEYVDHLKDICDRKGITLVEDCSQSIDTYVDGKHTGNFSVLSAFSFYPTKNLGCYGDGGAIATDDKNLYEILQKMRNYGQKEIYSAQMEGINSRLDELQALVLLEKIKNLKEKNSIRRKIMKKYRDGIKNKNVQLPSSRYFETSNGHLFPIFSKMRDQLRKHLEKEGITTAIHYPYPIHKQKYFYKNYSFPHSERLSSTELSLPIFPEMTEEEIEKVIDGVNSFR